MKNLICLIFAFISIVSVGQVLELPRDASPAATISQTIGITSIVVEYSRPAVNGREIWGALVPYGYNNLGFGTATEAPWRAGANENTTISFTHPVSIEGNELPAGTYGFFIALKEGGDEATIILSHDIKHWGSYFYDKNNDALRVDVQTEEIDMTERLTYQFVDIQPQTATLVLDWEKKRFPVKLSVNVPEIVFTRLDEQLKGETGFVDLSWNTAATYLLNNKIHLEAALNWADVAISTPYIGQENFNNLRLKAQILEALNRNQESEDLMARALEHPSADATGYYQYGRYLIGTDKNDKAMAIFEKLNKKWPDHWLAPHGMARGYSALGDFKNAVKFEKIAHNKAPEGSKGVIESYLQKLEAGEDFN